MDETTNLLLPYIMAAQAQKHVTHNEALRKLDALVHLSVVDRRRTEPPSNPENGARYIVAKTANGAWAGRDLEVAAFQDCAWAFYSPRQGWIAWVDEDKAAVVWDGTEWTKLTGGAGGGTTAPEPMPQLGVNATADTINRLTVASAATLLTHDGAGHQTKINKSGVTHTSSLLFQTAFSGRAEIETTGDDDLHVKVSADGTNWREALVIDRTTGICRFPHTPTLGGRDLLKGPRTYFVRLDRNDNSTGVTNTQTGAFQTIQRAFDVISATLDTGGFQ